VFASLPKRGHDCRRFFIGQGSSFRFKVARQVNVKNLGLGQFAYFPACESAFPLQDSVEVFSP